MRPFIFWAVQINEACLEGAPGLPEDVFEGVCPGVLLAVDLKVTPGEGPVLARGEVVEGNALIQVLVQLVGHTRLPADQAHHVDHQVHRDDVGPLVPENPQSPDQTGSVTGDQPCKVQLEDIEK